jgi:hypothetical protein
LRPGEIPTVAHAAALFMLAELGLRLVPLPRLARWMHVPVSLADDSAASPPSASPLVFSLSELRRINAVRRISPHLYGSRRGCLRRALVLGHLLRHRAPVLRLGVHRNDQVFAAHAWLEISGVQVMSAGFTPFFGPT